MALNDFICQAIKSSKIELIDMVKNLGHMPKIKSYAAFFLKSDRLVKVE